MMRCLPREEQTKTLSPLLLRLLCLLCLLRLLPAKERERSGGITSDFPPTRVA